MADFDSKQTTFWGAITASMWFGTSVFRYLAEKKALKLKKEEEIKMSADVKNIKDVVVFGNEFTLLVVKKLKDGFQPQDGMDIVSSLFMDGEVKSAFSAAISDISKVIEEAKDIDAAEGVQLGMLQLSYIPKIIDAFKK